MPSRNIPLLATVFCTSAIITAGAVIKLGGSILSDDQAATISQPVDQGSSSDDLSACVRGMMTERAPYIFDKPKTDNQLIEANYMPIPEACRQLHRVSIKNTFTVNKSLAL